MPRYFFNIRVGKELLVDPEGEEMPDPDHAWHVARATVREALLEGEQANLLHSVLEVTDEAGEIVLEFPFSEALIEDAEKSGTRH